MPPPTTGNPTTTPVIIDIRDIMNRTQASSVAVNQIGENHVRAMSMSVGVVSDEYFSRLHNITTSSLGQLQADLKALHRRMTAYADVMGPGETEFHQIRANAAAAIELADIYLSPTAFPQRAVQPENMQPAEILRPFDTLNAPTRPSTPAQENSVPAVAMTVPSTDETIDNSSKMQVDDDTVDQILQINLRQDERESYERLLEEPMEQIIDLPTEIHDPRDGSCTLAPGLILPLLGPGDVEVTVETSVGPEVPAEEIVENKTIRVDGVELPPLIPSAQVICRGCKRVGHIADLCPLTNCQQYKLDGWTEKGNDRLSASSDESAKNLPAPPAESTPSLVPQPPASDVLGGGTSQQPPTLVAERTDGKATTTPPQTARTSSTKQRRKSDDEGTTSTDHLPSSIGACTKARARKTTQPDAELAPIEKHPPVDGKLGGIHSNSAKTTKTTEKASNGQAGTSKSEKKIPDGPTKATRPVANVAGQTKIPGTSDNKKTVAEQILHKLATAETRPEGKPQTRAGKPKEVEKATMTQNHKTDTGDSDDVIITHDGTKQALTEPASPNTEKKTHH